MLKCYLVFEIHTRCQPKGGKFILNLGRKKYDFWQLNASQPVAIYCAGIDADFI